MVAASKAALTLVIWSLFWALKTLTKQTNTLCWRDLVKLSLLSSWNVFHKLQGSQTEPQQALVKSHTPVTLTVEKVSESLKNRKHD